MMNTRFLLSLLLVACNGVIGEPSIAPDDPDPRVVDSDTGACEDDVCLGRSGISRMTRAQYRYSVRQLFGDVTIDIERLPGDHSAGPFATNEAVPPTSRDVDLYAEMARGVAPLVVSGPQDFLSCVGSDAQACAEVLVETITPRAYRRPITNEERTAYSELMAWVLEEGSFDDALSVYIETVLQSPHFIYRIERANEEPTRLDGYEVATRLAHFLFRESPDDTLTAAAEDGTLDSAEGVMAQARRMVDDERADRAIREFHNEWMSVNGLNDVSRDDPGFDQELRDAMQQETELFAQSVIRDDDGTLRTLLTASWSVINSRLADHYGTEAPSGWARTAMPERAGLLTTGGVMTVHGSETFTRPIHRGVFLRKRVLCQTLAAPPEGAAAQGFEAAEELPDDLTERERLAALTEVGVCAGCHGLTNSVGYGLEAFDPLGRFRMTDSTGALVDINGAILDPGGYETDADGSFVGAHELGERLGQSETVARCVSRQWFRFALQRKESSADQNAIDQIYDAFAASGHQIREAMIAVTGTDPFLHRAARLLE